MDELVVTVEDVTPHGDPLPTFEVTARVRDVIETSRSTDRVGSTRYVIDRAARHLLWKTVRYCGLELHDWLSVREMDEDGELSVEATERVLRRSLDLIDRINAHPNRQLVLTLLADEFDRVDGYGFAASARLLDDVFTKADLLAD